jgi:hypothetical protein
MFRLTRYLDKHLRGHINFGTFHLLAVILRFRKDAVVLLVPRDLREDKHFNLQCGTTSLWYSSLDNMLTAAREYYGITAYQAWRCSRRYAALQRRNTR